jgi:hypothetical protein
MKSGGAANQRFSELLTEAQALMDKLRQQQGDRGYLDEDLLIELVSKVGHIAGFMDGVTSAGFSLMPNDLIERFYSLREDTRTLRYRAERPKPSA